MKVSVSLDEADVAFLDADVERGVYESRSAAVAASIRLLRERELTQSYLEEFQEWGESGEADAWDAASGDGLVSK
ncbi:ribbon-helix-helix protein, CopG family [Agromyces protaetiae]|uniref:Ribbon-helix-helix protein, CopG family n=1 Tax=Agromyces protaetiae TaxID=2509455 RepID=A0A4P6FD44_9MICO|nr:ribbon-helix-helix domain-containing protein [Agromyces protaetiae]QAY73626.1 ribbon-helix-helix protein, CopG family [Agromyces protaetiae]